MVKRLKCAYLNILTGIGEYLKIVYVLVLVTSINAKLPYYVHPCPRGTGGNLTCILDSIQNVAIHMKNGKTPYPSIDPMHVRFSKQEIKNPLMNVNLNLTNINIHGLSEFKITRSKFADTSSQLDLIFPKLKIGGNLVMDLHVFYFNGDGIQGTFNLNTTELEIFGKATSRVKKIKNIDHLIFDNVKIELWINNYDLVVRLDGYEYIEIAVNTWPMFQNNRLMMDSISPQIIRDMELIVSKWLQEFIGKYPYDEVAPVDYVSNPNML